MIMSQILIVAASLASSWSSASKLWNSLTALQWAAVISALLLMIGAVIEYRQQLKLLTFLTAKWFCRKSTPFDRCVFKKLLIHSIGPLLVVVGIGGEFIFEGRAFILEDRQEEEARRIVGSLGDKANKADEKADSAIGKSDALSKEEDTIHKRLDIASAQLGTLEKDLLAQGPRSKALDHGRTEFMAALKPFPGQRLTVVVCGQDDSDRFPFEQTLMNLVHESGWAAPESRHWQGCRMSLTGGNEIFVVSSVDLWQHAVSPSCAHDGGRQGASAAAQALCDALNKLRISTTVWILAPANQTHFPKESPPVNQLSVAVWARGFFGFGTPDSPAELAVQEPTKIFILVGPR